MKFCYYLLPLSCMTYLCGTQKKILKNIGKQTVWTKYTMEVNGNQNCLVTNIFLNTFLCVQQKKKCIQNGGRYDNRIFIFGWIIP